MFAHLWLMYFLQICTFVGEMFAQMWLFVHLWAKCLHKCGCLHICGRNVCTNVGVCTFVGFAHFTAPHAGPFPLLIGELKKKQGSAAGVTCVARK